MKVTYLISHACARAHPRMHLTVLIYKNLDNYKNLDFNLLFCNAFKIIDFLDTVIKNFIK